ncbi:hypothetical protein [Acetobacter pasteurianus]|uniref:Uncharacterized protein n=1 Tax=Acetobacter pasteurianus NBRC 3188 TaxID=1226663 RepID=A0A401WUT3_ACEPA|nr:hypothetical protein [Acetobacter pasteurianus]GCD53072.1 hypothetical protein NBRC3188_1769 [Acetobacter pasteurianus NBRC 3188]
MNRQEMLEALDKRVAEIKTEIESHQPDTQYAFVYGLSALDAQGKMVDNLMGTLGDASPLLCAAGASTSMAVVASASVPPLFYLSRLNTAVMSFLMQGGDGAVIRPEDTKTVSDIFKNNGQSPAGARH